MTDENRYRKAHRVVERYYEKLVAEVGEEVLRRERDFGQVSFSAAEEVLAGFAGRLEQVSQVARHLDTAARAREEHPPPPMQLAEIRAPEGGLPEAVNAWLAEHPDRTPVSLSTVSGMREMRCFVLYRVGKPKPPSMTRRRGF